MNDFGNCKNSVGLKPALAAVLAIAEIVHFFFDDYCL